MYKIWLSLEGIVWVMESEFVDRLFGGCNDYDQVSDNESPQSRITYQQGRL